MLKSIWQFCDGKKTIAGSALLLAGALNDQVIEGIWQYASPVLHNIGSTCEWVGMFVTAGGLGHKTQRKLATWREGDGT